MLDRRLLSELVLMALVTALMTCPLLERLRRRGVSAAGVLVPVDRGNGRQGSEPAIGLAG